jgi:hypothetical protein
VIEADGEQRDEATIYLDLCRAAGVSLFGSAVAQRLLEVATRLHGVRRAGAQRSVPQELVLSLLLRATRHGGFRALRRHPHGVLRPPHRADDFLGARVVTDDGRVHLAPPELVALAERLDAELERERALAGRLRLITRRAVHTHNSWTHNDDEFVAGGRDSNYLYLHPTDAAAHGLAEGDVADVSSATATVRVPVRLLDDLMPGTVALPHGWGHQHATGLTVASRVRGVNANLLAADGPDRLEPLSGMAHLTGIPVDVCRARGPLAPDSWSGIAPDRG